MSAKSDLRAFSHYGIGMKVHAIERRQDGRVAFTLWFTILFMPVFPLSSWSASYRGEFHDAIREDSHYFSDLIRIHRGFLCHAETFARSLLVLVLAIAPAAYLIDRTTGRAATTLEMVLVFASAGWPVLLVLLIERQRRKRLRGEWT